MIFLETETARLNRMVTEGAGRGLTELEFFARELELWKRSPRRAAQLAGEAYYRGEHDILRRKRTAIGADGKPQPVENLPNNRVVDNQYAKLVDQKVNYLLGRPVSFSCENRELARRLRERFGAQFWRLLKYVGEDALNGGLCWLFVSYDEQGTLSFRRFPAYQVLPFWADDDHTQLDAAARLYLQEVWDGWSKTLVERVELYKPDGLYRYVFDGAALLPDVELGAYSPYLAVKSGGETTAYAWDRFPLIPFKYNKQETPLLSRVKSLQDGLNAVLSDFQNNMEENPRNTILVLRNYDGENLGEFRHNLAAYSAVKVRDDGGVETLQAQVSAENYKAVLELLKKALIENARGFDAKDERLSGNPNQMNIQSMYADIDLDANGMETEFQAAFEQLLWFVRQDMRTKGEGDFSDEEIAVVFNRDVLVNESEAIENCAKSSGILSEETIVEQHPWTRDAAFELERLEKERAASDVYEGAFSQTGQG